MLSTKNGLGRGLGSLIPNKMNNTNSAVLGRDAINLPAQADRISATSNDRAENEQIIGLDTEKGMRILELEVDKIKANPYQPRNSFDHDGMEDLIRSIKEHGILQPLAVSRNEDGEYELIAGERRLRASKMAELKTVPVIVREVDKQKKLEWALIENIQRKDLNVIEEAVAYKRLMDEFYLTQDEVSHKVGKSLAVIANALRLLNLPKIIQEALIAGKIDKSAGRTIAGLENEEDQIKLFKELIEKGINVRQLERYVKRKKNIRKGNVEVLDFDVEEKKDMLQATLGTKVAIDKKDGRGKINIDFYSDEELAEIVNKICGREN